MKSLGTDKIQSEKFLSNNRGISLIEVMIAIGLISVLGLGLATMSYNGVKASNRSEGIQNLTGLSQTISSYTFYQNTCTPMLGSNPPAISYNSVSTSTVIPFELNLQNVGLIKGNQPVNPFSLNVTAFDLTNLQRVGTDTAGNSYVIGTLEITAELQKDALGGQHLKKRTVTSLHLRLDSSGRPTACAGTPLQQFQAGSGTSGTSTTNLSTVVLPDGTSVQQLITPTCDATCVVTQFFQRNSTGSDPVAEANAWMTQVGTTAYTTYANAYSMNQTLGISGVPLNAVDTGSALGYSQNTVDSWTAYTFAQYNNLSTTATDSGANLYQDTVSGYNAASSMWSQETIQNYISTSGVDMSNAAALIVNSGSTSGMTSTQISSALTQATSMYTADQIASYFASGNTLQDAINAGLISSP